MNTPVTSKQMREIEQKANDMGLSFLRLMENAGSAAYTVIKKSLSSQNTKVTILCGSGNNGGDGFVVARKLFENGYTATVILTNGDPQTSESRFMIKHLFNLPVQIIDYQKDKITAHTAIDECDILVDAVFGTGFHGDVSAEISELFERVNKTKKPTFSLDIPSGICADSALTSNAYITPTTTVVFSRLKIAHTILPSKELCGEIVLCDIGIDEETNFNLKNPIRLINENLIKNIIKPRTQTGNKGTFGTLLNVSGCENYSGAVILSTKSALRSGVGLVCVSTNEKTSLAIRGALPESVFITQTADEILSQKCSAILLGCGLSQSDDAKKLVKDVILNATVPVILDADGINCVKSDINILKEHKTKLILTPHVGEFARLIDEDISAVKQRRFALAQAFAKEYDLTLVLKDFVTVVCDKNSTYLYKDSNSGMAKGGSGDILAGAIASFVSQGYSLIDSALTGVFLHAKAGEITAEKLGERFMLPSDVINEFSSVLKKL